MRTLAVFVYLTKAFDKLRKEGLLFKLPRKRVCGNMYSLIQSYLFQRSARVRLDGQTSSSAKIREKVGPYHPFSSLFSLMAAVTSCPPTSQGRCMQMAYQYGQGTSAPIRMQEAMNLISDWTKEWLVMINRTKTEATCFSLSPKREVFIL